MSQLTNNHMTQTSLKSRSLADWLSYLEHHHPIAIDLGLERIRAVAQRMQLDSLAMPVVTVAGTNGKGSTCRLIEQLLLADGHSVGVYSSPHLLDYRERVRINDNLVDSELFCQAFTEIEQARAEISLTYFEVGTLAALWLFRRFAPDFVVLEVGLGGRLDATNIIDANVAVVTTIALDHEKFLGNDLAQIGREKAGIFRSHGNAVTGDPQIQSSVYEVAKSLHCELLANGQNIHAELSPDSQTWRYLGKQVEYSQLPVPDLPLDNAVAALAAIEQLGVSLTQSQVRYCIENWQLAGRMQRLQDAPVVYIDVAHNPQSAQYLATQLRRHRWHDKSYAVCAMLADKDNSGVVRELDGLFDNWFIAGLYGERGDDGSKLAQALQGQPFERFEHVNQAYKHALAKAGAADRVIVFGSFVTVAEVLSARGGS
ncbi:dihydrofolate synthase/folylpolyglutamate synthase [Celerinatantimonas diazotrophica]|uniref:Dihydrofolate synthase/folylpolyglutamate synthase n=2 Tax=Celerinatantimonas diazotrophica TaxID=412034 RepID=A0A4R1JAF6_9GAMM|nr:dihydrofolate synthase/folylpolyglutamate synthase [Celerinatantimonas diazotrophica]CAG9296915.1 Dihydrofolate synthase/folylpolyglutamate synthase [Celerinatantimonas diazotrophica]